MHGRDCKMSIWRNDYQVYRECRLADTQHNTHSWVVVQVHSRRKCKCRQGCNEASTSDTTDSLAPASSSAHASASASSSAPSSASADTNASASASASAPDSSSASADAYAYAYAYASPNC